MRALRSALMLLLLASPAYAQQWQFEDLDIPIAYFDNGAAQFQFACRGGDLAMGYWVRFPHHQVASSAAMNLAIIPDPSGAAASTADASFAQDIPLIHADGTSMIIRGPVARQWARIAQRAKTTIRLAYVRKQSALELFDSNDFSATGSAAAIKHILDRCG
ncbi:MAG TPA: hypothetical protein VG797_08810 [Phycisphaerales bacterium]|nr:hypothetical protein [Phycisphaerales bacterium]